MSVTHFMLSLPFQIELSPSNKQKNKPFVSHLHSILSTMVPNLDLILIAFLHGSFISCILLVFTFLVLICLLLAFSITLVSVILIDSYDVFLQISLYFGTLRANVELGFVLVLFTLMHFMVDAAFASKPWFERMVANFKVKAQHVVDQINDYQLSQAHQP